MIPNALPGRLRSPISQWAGGVLLHGVLLQYPALISPNWNSAVPGTTWLIGSGKIEKFGGEKQDKDLMFASPQR